MGDKDELSEFMQEYGNDYSATLTMGQLQHLVNEKNAAEARIQELEAHVERLRGALESIKNPAKTLVKEADSKGYEINGLALVEISKDVEVLKSWAEEALSETPAQSLEAKNWKAAEKLDQIVDSE